MELTELIGLKVFALKGDFGKKTKYVSLRYILFSDRKTYLRFDEQELHAYHDCDFSAKEMLLLQSKSEWKNIFSETPDATNIY